MLSPAFVRPLTFDGLNEADIRAEVVDPMLRSLGYQAGTTNNIVREHTFRYARQFLGRKKATDRPLEGKPDYVLEVGTVGRWLLEAKAPGAATGIEEFEQAQGYALHPNVAASLFVLTNGKEFRIFSQNAKSHNVPIFAFFYDQIEALWPQIYSILSPTGFKRSVPQIRFDMRRPVAPGYGARIQLTGGLATPLKARSSIELPDGAMRTLANLQSHIPSGTCERDANGRLAIKITFSSPSAFLDEIIRRKGLDTIPIYTESQDLSVDAEVPTLFAGEFTMVFGFDVV